MSEDAPPATEATPGNGLPAVTLEELRRFFTEEFPQAQAADIEATDWLYARVRRRVGDDSLRPGGTVSGPTMMGLADHATYVAILASIGIVPLAVTTSMHIDFLRKPAAGRDLVCEARLLKLGRRLAVADVSIVSEGAEGEVAHASLTYSIPPR